jgi:hypothetical protein
MMKKLYQIQWFLLGFMSFYSSSYARQSNLETPKIQGNFINSGLPDVKIVALQYVKGGRMSSDTFIPIKVHNGQFNIQLPASKTPYKIKMAIRRANNSIYWSSIYYAESNDDLDLIFIKNKESDSVAFSGVGSAKYNLAEKLKKEKNDFFTDWNRIGVGSEKDASKITLKIENAWSLVETTTKRSEASIDSAADVSPIIKSLLKQELVDYHYHFLFTLDYVYQRNQDNKELISIVKTQFNKNKDSFNTVPNEYSILCPDYVLHLSRWEQFNMQVNGGSHKLGLLELYNNVKKKYNGEIREMILANLLIKPNTNLSYTNSVYDSLVNDATTIIAKPYLKASVTELVKLKKGAPAFDSKFKDVNGQDVNLSSFKGKTIFIDVWFLGCTGCANFHKRFHKYIYSDFKKNPNFVYLSLNIDKSKSNWVKGITSGLYSSNEYVNVNTNGLGIKHPFTQYYNIMGGPYLLIIDKNGKIYGRPTLDLSNSDFSKWISEALHIKDDI